MKKYLIVLSIIFVFNNSCNNADISQKTGQGPVVEVIVKEGTNMAVALSPDNKTLALDLQGTIWVLPVKGGNAIPITDEMGDCHEPVWSPDGNHIAFFSYRGGNFHIWTIRKDGTELKQITTGIYDDREPDWSPDGKSIIFSSDRNGNYDIWQIDLNSSQMRALTSDKANEYNPAFSPDGNSIAFVSDREERGLYTIKDGSEIMIVPSSRISAPSWNTTGEKIMYISYGRASAQLNVVNANSKETDTIVRSEDIFPFRAAWLNEDTFIYTSNGKILKRKLGDEKVETIPLKAKLKLNRNSYERKQYNFDEQQERTPLGILGPVLSPDGSRVAFAALSDIYIQTIGGAFEKVTNDSFVDLDPDWSPDGKTLAYISDRRGKMEIWLRDLQTNKDRLLKTNIQGESFMPSWSPDGRKIAFYSRENDLVPWGFLKLNILDIGTGGLKTFSQSLHFPSKPSWSGNSDIITFMAIERYSTRFREGINKFCMVSLQDQSFRYVSPESENYPGMRYGNGPVWSPDGKKIAYVQNGVLWTIPVNNRGDIIGAPAQITDELADKPSWSGDSKSIVYIATDHLKKVYLDTGIASDVPIDLKWKPRISDEQYIIHAGRLFNGVDSTYLHNVDILIDGHRITSITLHQDRENIKVIDASDKVVMPGLFESHSHLQASDGEKLGKIWLSYGITSVREPGADPYDALERRESWSAGIRPGPRLFFAGGLWDGNRIYYGLSNSITSGTHLRMELERSSKLGYDMIKTYVRMPDSLQKEITIAAHKMGIPVSSHELYPAASYNVDATEHLTGTTSRRGYTQRMTSLHKMYDDALQLTAASGICLTPTLVMGGFVKVVNENASLADNKQYRAFFSREYIDSWKKRASTSDYREREEDNEIKAIIQRGGNVTAGTDSPQVPYGTSLHAELWLYVREGLSPFQALQTATINAAKAVGVGKDLGSVEPGKLADVVIVNGDPLNNISDAWNVDKVIKNGILYEINDLLPNNTNAINRTIQ